ncbi:hypothetical protein SEA_KARP_72 [Streptomyces phage Karp]|nr:hypothetical protein SEA_KARP_72 [Streptomyces phage Karp]
MSDYMDCDACDWVDIEVGMQMVRPDHFCRVKAHRINAYAHYDNLRGQELIDAVEENWPPFWDESLESIE